MTQWHTFNNIATQLTLSFNICSAPTSPPDNLHQFTLSSSHTYMQTKSYNVLRMEGSKPRFIFTTFKTATNDAIPCSIPALDL